MSERDLIRLRDEFKANLLGMSPFGRLAHDILVSATAIQGILNEGGEEGRWEAVDQVSERRRTLTEARKWLQDPEMAVRALDDLCAVYG